MKHTFRSSAAMGSRNMRKSAEDQAVQNLLAEVAERYHCSQKDIALAIQGMCQGGALPTDNRKSLAEQFAKALRAQTEPAERMTADMARAILKG